MIPKIIYLTGVANVLQNLKRADTRMQHRVEKGLIAGAKYLREKSREIVPVQMGALKSSAFMPRNVGGKGFKADIIVGYAGCDYAIYVHEDLVMQAPPARAAHGKFFNIKHAQEIALARGTWLGTAEGGMFKRGENQQAKFLEQPMRDYRNDILQIIGNAVKIGKKI